MNEIQYIGENLRFGQWGHFAVVLAFVSALFAAIAYLISASAKDEAENHTWRRYGRAMFFTHTGAILLVILLLFYMMINQMYEYQYVWAHVSSDLPMKYIFSAFWEGQEGSFLLWMFFHVWLGVILIFTAKKWESPVMLPMAIAQAFLTVMIIGLYIPWAGTEVKIGSNPFVLLRNAMDAPIFASANYLQNIDGNGLNPLLQNYWMTIHPPVLFIGFAAVIVPFCYAFAGLWTNDHKGWLKPALPWALFAGGALGTGILMGGAWAYEALSFGGYWAWDPVENMSLVPWLILIAGIHTHLIAQSTGRAVKTTYFFYISAFLLILYSTFLTRSGILGDTSVHSFTDMGLGGQLLAQISFFTILAFGFLIYRLKQIPSVKKEERLDSREFWMFIGSLILLFSSVLIGFSTSIPVFNEVFKVITNVTGIDLSHLHRTSPQDPVEHYNRYQMWIGFAIALMSGVILWLRYGVLGLSVSMRKALSIRVGAILAISFLLTWLLADLLHAFAWQYRLLLFSAIFGISINTDYIVSGLKGKLKLAGSALSHFGFAMMIFGVIASGLGKNVISQGNFMSANTIDGFNTEDTGKNVLLYKGLPTQMGPYMVTYTGDFMENHIRYFKVDYERTNEEGDVVESFRLTPNVLYSRAGDNIEASNPSTRHYWFWDVFTHVTALPASEMTAEAARAAEDSLQYVSHRVIQGDTFYTRKHFGVLEDITFRPENPLYQQADNDVAIGFNFRFYKLNEDTSWTAQPVYFIRDEGRSREFAVADEIAELGIKLRLPPGFYDEMYEIQDALQYETIEFRTGDTIKLRNYEYYLEGLNTTPQHAQYAARDGDIAIGAMLRVIDPVSGDKANLKPVYLIRDRQQFNYRDQWREKGVNIQFISVNPERESISLKISEGAPIREIIQVEIAEDVPRRDYIVLQAIVFPGINFFWFGTIVMMIGFFVAMWHRLSIIRR